VCWIFARELGNGKLTRLTGKTRDGWDGLDFENPKPANSLCPCRRVSMSRNVDLSEALKDKWVVEFRYFPKYGGMICPAMEKGTTCLFPRF